jgi:excisionase family DNA binding protein
MEATQLLEIPSRKVAYSIDDIVAITPLSRSTVKALLASGALRCVRVGRRVLIPREALDELLQRGAT